MKRIVILVLAIGLVFGSIATAEAGKKKKKPVKTTREAQGAYDAPTPVAAGGCAQTGAVGCVTIPSAPGEIYVTATVTDATGTPVPVSVQADLDGNNQSDTTYGSFCGSTSEPLLVDAGATIQFWVGITPGAVALACPGFATTGTVDVVFSNMP
jgi:hypothetical protein